MKIKTICKLFIFCSIFFVMSGFAVTPNNNQITFTDPQKPLIVKKSQPIFTIFLQSNPTTGFSWALKNFDSNLIKPIKRVYFPGNKSLIGSGGYEKWTFSVRPDGFVVPQTTSITLIYSRSWELEGAQATNFKVVTINDD